MGVAAGIAINEGVSLLEKLSPSRLHVLRGEYSLLSDELGLGIYAGSEEDQKGGQEGDLHLNAKASIMIAALSEAWKAADDALATVSRRIRTARRERLISQALVVIGSSSSLATLALSKNRA